MAVTRMYLVGDGKPDARLARPATRAPVVNAVEGAEATKVANDTMVQAS